MFLPEPLIASVMDLLEEEHLSTLKRASDSLSSTYRDSSKPKIEGKDHLAYIAARLPATYASARFVFDKLDLEPSTLLDLGAGPGGNAWSAFESFPSLRKVTLIEKDTQFIHIAKKLLKSHPLVSSIHLQQADLHSASFAPHDLVLLSYCYGEIGDLSLLQKAWTAAKEALIVIEPGTPRGFETILQARAQISAWGGHMLAPCPHADQCPLKNPQWCHFAARVARTSLHRRVKSAELSYEDEKLSYVVFTKQKPLSLPLRIIKTPEKHAGHLQLTLCTPTGIEKKTLSRKHKELYKAAQKKKWGDEL